MYHHGGIKTVCYFEILMDWYIHYISFTRQMFPLQLCHDIGKE